MTFDVAIIGGGIVGAACADRLTAEGLSVAVIDRPAFFPSATAAGMGHIVVMDDSEAQFALTSYSQKLWDELAEELPEDAEFENCGTLWIAADDEELAEAGRKREYYNARGIAAEVIDGRSLREAEPGLREGLAGALHIPGDSVVYQPVIAKMLLDRAVSRGTYTFGFESLTVTRDGKIKDSFNDTFHAGAVVVAAGCGSPELVPELKVVPRKGHLVITERTGSAVSHQLIELGYIKSAHGNASESVAFNIQPRKTGQLLIGSSRQYGADYDEVDIEIVRKMMTRAVDYFPPAANLHATRIWTGFRPATPDGLPYIGKVPGYENVYAATGHEGLGITTALGTAVLIADEIIGRASEIPREPYSPARTDG